MTTAVRDARGFEGNVPKGWEEDPRLLRHMVETGFRAVVLHPGFSFSEVTGANHYAARVDGDLPLSGPVLDHLTTKDWGMGTTVYRVRMAGPGKAHHHLGLTATIDRFQTYVPQETDRPPLFAEKHTRSSGWHPALSSFGASVGFFLGLVKEGTAPPQEKPFLVVTSGLPEETKVGVWGALEDMAERGATIKSLGEEDMAKNPVYWAMQIGEENRRRVAGVVMRTLGFVVDGGGAAVVSRDPPLPPPVPPSPLSPEDVGNWMKSGFGKPIRGVPLPVYPFTRIRGGGTSSGPPSLLGARVGAFFHHHPDAPPSFPEGTVGVKETPALPDPHLTTLHNAVVPYTEGTFLLCVGCSYTLHHPNGVALVPPIRGTLRLFRQDGVESPMARARTGPWNVPETFNTVPSITPYRPGDPPALTRSLATATVCWPFSDPEETGEDVFRSETSSPWARNVVPWYREDNEQRLDLALNRTAADAPAASWRPELVVLSRNPPEETGVLA